MEIAVLADAVNEFVRMPDFSSVFGKTVPSQSAVTQVLTAAEQWSTMRNAASNWDMYCRTQEGLSWQAARTLLASMKTAFALAAKIDDTLATQNPSAVALFDVKSTIAKRAAATRRANRNATLAGEEPTQGKVRKKAAKLAKLVAEGQRECGGRSDDDAGVARCRSDAHALKGRGTRGSRFHARAARAGQEGSGQFQRNRKQPPHAACESSSHPPPRSLRSWPAARRPPRRHP